MINSPIFYMGNKKRLIEKGLINLFPQDINTFVDLFTGSGIVSMNVRANNYIMNDINSNIIDLLCLFKYKTADEIINYIETTIKNFELLKGFNKRDKTETEEYKELAKEKYILFRKYYNENKNILDLYILSYYCNNNNIRFNKKGDFNMPIGNQYFNKEKHSQKIIDGCKFLSQDNVNLYNTDFRTLNYNTLSEKDFVYFDPPYSNTLAIYNEQQGWCLNDDLDVFNLCDLLNKNHIRFALSNVFVNKGKENTHLIEWANKYNVHHFEDFTYVSCGKGNAKTDEVLIYNY